VAQVQATATVPPPDFSIEQLVGADSAVLLRPCGELDLATAPALEQQLLDVEEQACSLTIDLSGLTFIDSTGLHALVAARRRALEGGRTLRLIRGALTVQRLFEMTGTEPLFTFVDDAVSAAE